MAINFTAPINARFVDFIYNTPEYSATETYQRGDVISQGGRVYYNILAVGDTSTGVAPPIPGETNATWREIGEGTTGGDADVIRTLVDGEDYQIGDFILNLVDTNLYRAIQDFTQDDQTDTFASLANDRVIERVSTGLGVEQLRNVEGDLSAPSGSSLVFDSDTDTWSPSRVPTSTRGSYRLEFDDLVLSGEATTDAVPYTNTFEVDGASSNVDNTQETAVIRINENTNLGVERQFNSGFNIFFTRPVTDLTADNFYTLVCRLSRFDLTFNYANGETEAFTFAAQFGSASRNQANIPAADPQTDLRTPEALRNICRNAINGVADTAPNQSITRADGTTLHQSLNAVLGTDNWEVIDIPDNADGDPGFRIQIIDLDDIPLTGTRTLSTDADPWRIQFEMEWIAGGNTQRVRFDTISTGGGDNFTTDETDFTNTPAGIGFTNRLTITFGGNDYVVDTNPGNATTPADDASVFAPAIATALQGMNIPGLIVSDAVLVNGNYDITLTSIAFGNVVIGGSQETIPDTVNAAAFGSDFNANVNVVQGEQGSLGTVIRIDYTDATGQRRNNIVSLEATNAANSTRDRVRQAIQAYFNGTATVAGTDTVINAPAVRWTVVDVGTDSLRVASPDALSAAEANNLTFDIDVSVPGTNSMGFGFSNEVIGDPVVAVGDPTVLNFTFDILGVETPVTMTFPSFHGAGGDNIDNPGSIQEVYQFINDQIEAADIDNLSIFPETITDHLIFSSPLGVDLNSTLTITDPGGVITGPDTTADFVTAFDITINQIQTTDIPFTVDVADTFTFDIVNGGIEDVAGVLAQISTDYIDNVAGSVHNEITGSTIRLFGNDAFNNINNRRITTDDGSAFIEFSVQQAGISFPNPGADLSDIYTRISTGLTDALIGWPVVGPANLAGTTDEDLTDNSGRLLEFLRTDEGEAEWRLVPPGSATTPFIQSARSTADGGQTDRVPSEAAVGDAIDVSANTRIEIDADEIDTGILDAQQVVTRFYDASAGTVTTDNRPLPSALTTVNMGRASWQFINGEWTLTNFAASEVPNPIEALSLYLEGGAAAITNYDGTNNFDALDIGFYDIREPLEVTATRTTVDSRGRFEITLSGTQTLAAGNNIIIDYLNNGDSLR
ncbi:MAG: hypothetical protein GDA45_07340, partial [Chromatiales bacterium]|nr:hypothetical protein [Chromatiales bacterium]